LGYDKGATDEAIDGDPDWLIKLLNQALEVMSGLMPSSYAEHLATARILR
jgi:hypothetical protein